MILQNEMYSVTATGADSIGVRLNATHPIYRAHFPDHPITPGVCLVQMVGELLGDRVGRRLQLSKVVNLKFIAPISPLEKPDLEVRFAAVDDDGTQLKARGSIETGGKVLTKFSLVFV